MLRAFAVRAFALLVMALAAFLTWDFPLHRPALAAESRPEPYEVRLRVAGRSPDRKAAEAVGFEVRSMHMHGPGGAGGGIGPRVREVLAVKSVLLPRELVKPEVLLEGRP